MGASMPHTVFHPGTAQCTLVESPSNHTLCSRCVWAPSCTTTHHQMPSTCHRCHHYSVRTAINGAEKNLTGVAPSPEWPTMKGRGRQALLQHHATWSPKKGTAVQHSWLLLDIAEPCGERMATGSLRVCPHVCGGAQQV